MNSQLQRWLSLTIACTLAACSGSHGGSVIPAPGSQNVLKSPKAFFSSGCTAQSQAVGTISEYALPAGYSGPNGVAFNPATGSVWTVITSPAAVAEFAPSTQTWNTAVRLTASNAGPVNITIGPDGNPWFTEFYSNAGPGNVGVIRVNNGNQLQEYSVPRAYGITTNPNGYMYAGSTNGRITRLDTNGPNQSYAQSPYQFNMTSDANQNVWYGTTNPSVNKIIKIAPDGTTTPYSPPSGEGAYGITEGAPGQGMWFTEWYGNRIGQVTATGVLKEWTLPQANSNPADIVVACGNVWFAEYNVNKIGEFNPVTGTITQYPVTTANAGPSRLTVDSNGQVWFSEQNSNKIARIVTATTQPSTYVLASYGSKSCGSGCVIQDSDQIFAFDPTSSGTVTATYALTSNSLNYPVGTIAADNTVWIVNDATSMAHAAIYQFPALSSAYNINTPNPLNTISGTNTRLNYASEIGVDAGGDAFVLNLNSYFPQPGINGVAVLKFANGATNNASPTVIPAEADATHTGLMEPADIAVDASGTLFVADRSSNPTASPQPSGDVAVFAPGASGDIAPTYTIGGSNTQITYPSAVSVDAVGRVYVLVNDSWAAATQYQQNSLPIPFVNGRILVFAAGSQGNVAPIAVISGGMSAPLAMRVDPSGGAYLADYGAEAILYYAPGSNGAVGPTRQFTDAQASSGFGFGTVGL